MAPRTEMELKRKISRQEEIVKILKEKWLRDRKITVRQVRELADEIQRHEENSRIAKLTGTSVSIVGSAIAIGGAVAAFFTFGASLLVSAAGAVIAGTGGATVLGTEITNAVLSSSAFKQVERALEKDKDSTCALVKEIEKLEELLDELNKTRRQQCVGKIGKMSAAFCGTVYNAGKFGTQFALKAGNEAGETVFKTLGKAAKGFHVAGLALGAVFIAVDIHTLVTTSIDVHKGSIVKVVVDIRKVAQDLEDEMAKPFFMANSDDEPC